MLRTMKVGKGVLLAIAVMVVGGSATARSAMPRDGSPYPPNSWGDWEYFWGGVQNKSTTLSRLWDLTTHIDSPGLKSMKVFGMNSVAGPTQCFGVATDELGVQAFGTPVNMSGSCGFKGFLDTPNVNVPSGGFFMVECNLPPESVCRASLLSYRYNQ
jgi:hypothetical protein